MDENKKIREVKVVGYSRELLLLQLTMLITVFSLLGVAVSDGWWSTLFIACFLCLFGFSLLQALRLHRKGVTISIYDLDDSGDAGIDDEQPQDIIDDEINTDEEIQSDENGDPLDKPHWTDDSYPDPDVELGLKNQLAAENGSSVENGNSGAKTQVAENDSA